MTRSPLRLTLALAALASLATLAACKDSAPPAAPTADTSAPVTTATMPVAPTPPSTTTTTGATAAPPSATSTSAPAPGPAAGGDFFACAADADCVAAPKNECCNNGHMEAVNKTKVDAYKASFTCPNPKPICPHYRVNDTRTPVCDAKTHQCAMSDTK